MNTIWADRHGVHDALARPSDLANWLNGTGAYDHPPRVTHHDLDQAESTRRETSRVRHGPEKIGMPFHGMNWWLCTTRQR